MESLSETTWDVLISGTGLQQSLLALWVSISATLDKNEGGKKVLHVDKNSFYGGPDAAFSLQEAEEWVKAVESDPSPSPLFSNVSVTSTSQPEQATRSGESAKLAPSRSYSLSLSPQLIYNRSALLPILVSSKVFRQLEFLAIGSWWVYNPLRAISDDTSSSTVDSGFSPGIGEAEQYRGREERPSKRRRGELKKVPNGREDVFTDPTIDLKSKRSLMKFLRFVTDYENQPDVWEPWASSPFSEFLASRFNFPLSLQTPVLALTMTLDAPDGTTTGFALPRIARHLKSIGVFGPGFGAVIPKWGGGAEISQVACRAGAVGGGVYMLGNDVEVVNQGSGNETHTSEGTQGGGHEGLVEVQLRSGDEIKTKWIVGSECDFPAPRVTSGSSRELSSTKSISVVSSPLSPLFPIIAEGAPPAAGAVVVFPPGSLSVGPEDTPAGGIPPVYVIVHSSSTGECPDGQCVLYASVSAEARHGHSLLDKAIESLLGGVGGDISPEVLYQIRYTQTSASPLSDKVPQELETPPTTLNTPKNVLLFPSPSLGLVFDDSILERVKMFWGVIVGESRDEEDGEDFMVFEDREGFGTDMSDDE
ncbi:MAG: Rab proteins geranylgeranyltransferase component A [Trichoglossum hirsutum]|nr:MAG: Rab proteins geranylgeranyltransferase component A [Trichoglossum hirsutum]